MTPIHPFTATLTEKRFFCDGVSLFTFQIADSTLDFAPGQYVVLDVPSTPTPVKRLYSIASAPSQSSSFELLIKNVPGGVASAYIESLAFGQTVSFSGPAGLFSYKESEKPKVFMATGTGFAPMRSILFSLSKTDVTKKTLLWGLSSLKNTYLFSELLALEKTLPSFSFLYCLSQETSLAGIPAYFRHYFRLGRIDRVWEELSDKQITHNDYYFCGSRDIVESLRLLFLSKNIEPSALHFEKY